MARIFQDTREKRELGSKAPWWVEWRINGSRRSEKVGSKKLAKEIASVKDSEKLKKRHGLTIDKRWDEFVKQYSESELPKMRSVHSRVLAAYILKRFGDTMKPKFVGLIDDLTLDQYAGKRLKDRGLKAGEKLAPATVMKELRTIRAALAVAHRWRFLDAVPSMPEVDDHESDKRFVAVKDFEAMLKVLDPAADGYHEPRLPVVASAPFTPADWWRALLLTLWVSGMRIGAALALKWSDVDLEAGTAWSRARDNKAKKDQRIDIQPAVELLRKLKGFDPRVFPWDRERTALYVHFEKLQTAAGIKLDCPGNHEHTDRCHVYGFHDFRRAHATYNHGKVSDKDLQAQMGHASFSTTERYIKYANDHKQKEYKAFLPESLKTAAG